MDVSSKQLLLVCLCSVIFNLNNFPQRGDAHRLSFLTGTRTGSEERIGEPFLSSRVLTAEGWRWSMQCTRKVDEALRESAREVVRMEKDSDNRVRSNRRDKKRRKRDVDGNAKPSRTNEDREEELQIEERGERENRREGRRRGGKGKGTGNGIPGWYVLEDVWERINLEKEREARQKELEGKTLPNIFLGMREKEKRVNVEVSSEDATRSERRGTNSGTAGRRKVRKGSSRKGGRGKGERGGDGPRMEVEYGTRYMERGPRSSTTRRNQANVREEAKRSGRRTREATPRVRGPILLRPLRSAPGLDAAVSGLMFREVDAATANEGGCSFDRGSDSSPPTAKVVVFFRKAVISGRVGIQGRLHGRRRESSGAEVGGGIDGEEKGGNRKYMECEIRAHVRHLSVLVSIRAEEERRDGERLESEGGSMGGGGGWKWGPEPRGETKEREEKEKDITDEKSSEKEGEAKKSDDVREYNEEVIKPSLETVTEGNFLRRIGESARGDIGDCSARRICRGVEASGVGNASSIPDSGKRARQNVTETKNDSATNEEKKELSEILAGAGSARGVRGAEGERRARMQDRVGRVMGADREDVAPKYSNVLGLWWVRWLTDERGWGFDRRSNRRHPVSRGLDLGRIRGKRKRSLDNGGAELDRAEEGGSGEGKVKDFVQVKPIIVSSLKSEKKEYNGLIINTEDEGLNDGGRKEEGHLDILQGDSNEKTTFEVPYPNGNISDSASDSYDDPIKTNVISNDKYISLEDEVEDNDGLDEYIRGNCSIPSNSSFDTKCSNNKTSEGRNGRERRSGRGARRFAKNGSSGSRIFMKWDSSVGGRPLIRYYGCDMDFVWLKKTWASELQHDTNLEAKVPEPIIVKQEMEELFFSGVKRMVSMFSERTVHRILAADLASKMGYILSYG